MLAARITLPHLSMSFAISVANSAGEVTTTVPPSSVILVFNFGSASAIAICLFYLSMISGGVFLGAAIPFQPMAS
jgi:hypothetical protein